MIKYGNVTCGLWIACQSGDLSFGGYTYPNDGKRACFSQFKYLGADPFLYYILVLPSNSKGHSTTDFQVSVPIRSLKLTFITNLKGL